MISGMIFQPYAPMKNADTRIKEIVAQVLFQLSSDIIFPSPLSRRIRYTHFFVMSSAIRRAVFSYFAGALQPVFYFRTKERNPGEIDLIIEENQTLYPVEIKKSATLDKNDVKQFPKLATFKMQIGTGALVSLYPQVSHIDENILTIPAPLL